MDISVHNFEHFFRIFLAALLGGLIGIERERLSSVAGLRTHMLVCVGSALIMIVSQYGFDEVLKEGFVVLDPSRVAAQVVSGIGFLGAGTILFWKEKIRGLTTAASLWAVSAIGLAVGGGLYIIAISVTALIFLILIGLKPFERHFLKKTYGAVIEIIANPNGVDMGHLKEIISSFCSIQQVNIYFETRGDKEHYLLTFKSIKPDLLMRISQELKKNEEIESIEIVN